MFEETTGQSLVGFSPTPQLNTHHDHAHSWLKL